MSRRTAPFLDRLAARFRVDRAAPSGVRPYAAPGLVPHRARHRLSLSRPARPPRPARTRCWSGSSFGGWIALEMAVRSQSTDRPARADRLARGQVRRPRGARHRRHLRPAGRRGARAAPLPTRRVTSPITQRSTTARLLAIARDREATALYGWKPYMHDPALVHWLHRITPAGAGAVGREGRHRRALLRRASRRRAAERTLRADRQRRRTTRRSNSPTRSPPRSSASLQ